MLNNLDPKSKLRPGLLGGAKRSRLSLNLHTMPQTISGHWKNWLLLGFLILGIFAVASLALYFFSK